MMLKTLPAATLALAMSLTLAACGGGGGGSDSNAAASSSPAVTFSPAKLTGTFVAGTAYALTVSATATRPSDFNGVTTVYAFIVDDSGLIQTNPTITAVSTTQYNARMTTLTTLTAGTKTGNLSLRLCKDSACAAQFSGSPVALPYELVVTAKP